MIGNSVIRKPSIDGLFLITNLNFRQKFWPKIFTEIVLFLKEKSVDTKDNNYLQKNLLSSTKSSSKFRTNATK